ncbi:hypothetical protein BASA50_001160 [Batrachochytrium salamandrivorans]|uniref:Galactose oxidase-like Early set domain-containing protein n=1 Tax=Batrachochytrium salamandrivorans TaxID=1357716 RepID=A0ABQ8ERU2_9FUNG|nr:hypothetical protein BASA60_008831 [Batrachochytrium salamandrivorans]KAH6578061.1 hypothetical protein BASA62_000500 [Batrachochytrium salamandrivorans]KAH6579142.1 hypothetical protein BASA61_010444 [Batrachochytrium salamandrivorans]KAH6585551.1 hypothetical protein BASA50_001160 [Batrachochytrium salamandrivorans]KAH9271381.1 hypothetical protein BASA83_006473 [Batrachochytrium salamandrivorans]
MLLFGSWPLHSSTAISLVFSLAAAQYNGVWTPAGISGVTCIHSALLPDSKLICNERPHQKMYPSNPNTNGLVSSEINLLSGTTVDSFAPWSATFVPRPVDTNPLCAGQSLMANGSFFIAGGDQYGDRNGTFPPDGRKGRRIYNPCPSGSPSDCVGNWVNLPEMTTQRWYPTITTIADGSQIIVGGSTDAMDFNKLVPINNPTYEYWPSKSTDPKTLPILAWAFPNMLYPMVFVMPSERIFLFVSNKSVIIDPKTDEQIYTVPDMPVMDHAPWIYPHTPAMTVLPMTIKNNFQFVLQICGGSRNSTIYASGMCWHINPDDPNPTWTLEEGMPRGRLLPDCVIMPDGKLLYVNGAGWGTAGGDPGDVLNAGDPIMIPDVFDPTAPSGQKWTSLAPATNYRLYHSGAMLTESGFIITMGSDMVNYDDYWKYNKTNCMPVVQAYTPGECLSPFNLNIERLAPPYMQIAEKNGRPVISKAPNATTYQSSFMVEMSSPVGNVARVTFIRHSSTTHQTNTDQRFIELKILGQSGNSLVLQAPDVPGRAPPGRWFLFALDSNGIPSVAKTVFLQLGPPTTIPTGSYSTAGRNISQVTPVISILSLILAAICSSLII